MNEYLAADLLVQGIYTLLMILLPVLVVALLVALVTALLQSATTVQEATLSQVPRLVCVLICLIFAGPWMLRTLVAFTTRLLRDFSRYVG